MILQTFITPLVLLLSVCSLTALSKAFQILGRIDLKREFVRKPHYYFFYSIIKRTFPKDKWNSLFYLVSFTKYLLQLLYATTFFFYLLTLFFREGLSLTEMPILSIFPHILLAIIIVIASGLFFEFLVHLAVNQDSLLLLKLATPLSTFLFVIFFPLSFPFFKTQDLLFRKRKGKMATSAKDKILELVQESELSTLLDPLDRRLITSVASFSDRIVREIMVPRIDVFSLSVNQTVHEAAQKFISEGYSRIPVYKDSVDSIIGVLLYKDVMDYYFHSIEKKETSPLETPLEKLVKPILYTPETKKISRLLQEIRKKQIHLAIVVDEYGGTEGIITMEDILEELVGEIADEHDVIEEEKFYFPHPGGGWIIDAKMSILDIEKELGISIPHSPEYDTIGGFVFHRAGTIPSKGWKMHNDNFDLEVVSTSERTIEKVILTSPIEKE